MIVAKADVIPESIALIQASSTISGEAVGVISKALLSYGIPHRRVRIRIGRIRADQYAASKEGISCVDHQDAVVLDTASPALLTIGDRLEPGDASGLISDVADGLLLGEELGFAVIVVQQRQGDI